MKPIEREIRYESDRDPAFADEIRHMPGCELIDRCIQCATCSGICPLSTYMDQTPRRIIQLTRAGFKQDVLNCNTIWLCTSCYQCQVECPKEIGITDVMYALKCKAIEYGIFPKRFGPTVMYREFFDIAETHGRLSEGPLMTRVLMKSQPTRAWSLRRLGISMLRTKRFSMRTERMENVKPFHANIQSLQPIDGRKRR